MEETRIYQSPIRVKASAIVLAVCIALMIITAAVGHMIQTSWGTVSTQEITFTTDVGATVHAKLYVPEDSPLVSTLLRVYREQTGLEGQPKSIGGGTYAKALPNIVAFGPIFPGEEVREHKPDEYISVDSLMRNAQIIADAMYEMAK